MKLARHIGTLEEKILKGLLNTGFISGRARRPFTRPAIYPWQARIQLAISVRAAKKIPKLKEKRLINGKWTRDYSSEHINIPRRSQLSSHLSI